MSWEGPSTLCSLSDIPNARAPRDVVFCQSTSASPSDRRPCRSPAPSSPITPPWRHHDRGDSRAFVRVKMVAPSATRSPAGMTRPRKPRSPSRIGCETPWPEIRDGGHQGIETKSQSELQSRARAPQLGGALGDIRARLRREGSTGFDDRAPAEGDHVGDAARPRRLANPTLGDVAQARRRSEREGGEHRHELNIL